MTQIWTNLLYAFCCCLILGLASKRSFSNQVLTLSENTRLEVSIAAESMNRLAVMNDRIAQLYEDEGTFVSQADEQTGQVFLKPTPENGTKPLSITFITENGVTQDLILKPTAKQATTIIFKNTMPSLAPSAKPFSQSFMDSAEKNLSIQDQLLAIMKQLISGQLPKTEGEVGLRETPEGFSLEPQYTYHAHTHHGAPYRAQTFTIQNTTSTPIELLEKSFYQNGDLALSLEKRVLLPNQKTTLYVIRRIG